MQVMQEAKRTFNSFNLSQRKKDVNAVIQVHPFELIYECQLFANNIRQKLLHTMTRNIKKNCFLRIEQ